MYNILFDTLLFEDHRPVVASGVPVCRSTGQRWVHAILWELATIVTFGLILGICYGRSFLLIFCMTCQLPCLVEGGGCLLSNGKLAI